MTAQGHSTQAAAEKKAALFHRDLRATYPVITHGDGIYLYDQEGKRYIDGTSGAGNVTLGHGNARIANAMADQARTLAYCFSQFYTNAPALELAERIAALAPGDLNHVYFVSGGSEGIETALKLARQYHLQQGNAQKQQVISRWRGYHGATLGALAVTGSPALRAPFASWLPDFPKIAPCYPYRCRFAGCEGSCNLTCADELERAIVQVGPENVAAFVAEPVVLAGVAAGSPPPDYFPRIRQICDKYDVLLIADEVITGFGRTGAYFAVEHWDVVPDMIVFAKGISSGYIPLGGVILREKIRDSFAEHDGAFAHVFTNVNNPVAMRVGLEVLDIIAETGLMEHVRSLGEHLQKRAALLHRHAAVGEVRVKGLMLGIELVRNKSSKEPFDATLGVHARMRTLLLEKGLSMTGVGGAADWINGDDLRFYPPLTITRQELDEALAILDEGLGELDEELSLRRR